VVPAGVDGVVTVSAADALVGLVAGDHGVGQGEGDWVCAEKVCAEDAAAAGRDV
jgi:hypothetical protein